MFNEETTQQEIDQEIENWRKSKSSDPLIIEFDDGEKFVFVKAA